MRHVHPPSSAHVKIVTAWNATFFEAFQFDDEDDLTWNFSNKSFRSDIKGNFEQDAALLSLTSGDGEIVVDDVTKRILHFNCLEAAFQAVLVPGNYVYDLVMIDDVTGTRTQLMHGEFVLTKAVTGG